MWCRIIWKYLKLIYDESWRLEFYFVLYRTVLYVLYRTVIFSFLFFYLTRHYSWKVWFCELRILHKKNGNKKCGFLMFFGQLFRFFPQYAGWQKKFKEKNWIRNGVLVCSSINAERNERDAVHDDCTGQSREIIFYHRTYCALWHEICVRAVRFWFLTILILYSLNTILP